ncbi:hypothetical protein MASR2M78_31940 [Treponema sp.]
MLALTAQTNTPETQKSGKGLAFSRDKQTSLAKLFSSLLTEAKSLEKKGAELSAKAPIKEVQSESKNGDRAKKEILAKAGEKILDLKKTKNKGTASVPPLDRGAKSELAAGSKQNIKTALENAEQKTGKEQSLQIRTDQKKDDGPEAPHSAKKRGRSEEADPTGANLIALLAGGAKKQESGSTAKKAEASDEKVEAGSFKKQDKRKERLSVEVHDFRTSKGLAESNEGFLPASSSDKKVAETELSVHLHSEASHTDAGETKTSRPSNSPASFSELLAKELRENTNADIVRHASMVLKDGGEGLIRLSLKPDSLGAVKIRLEMADNKIAGRILVESEEALKAFEKELRSLEQAFLDGGFDGASLELAVSSDGTGGGSGNPTGQEGPKPFFSDRLVASTYDASLSTLGVQEASSTSSQTVNMLA